MITGRPGKKIMCLNDGLIFSSITSAAQHYKLSRSAISKQLGGSRSHAGGLSFIYVDENLSADELTHLRKQMILEIYNLKNLKL